MSIQKTGYQNFGSFHTQSVQSLVSGSDEEYQPPDIPFDFVNHALVELENLPLGKPCRKLFYIDFNNWTFVNHGAFGGVCKPAQLEADAWRHYCETQPLRFIDRELFPQVVRVVRQVARAVHCEPQDLVFLSNATAGLNAAIRGASLRPGQVVYMLDLGYGSVKKMVKAYYGDVGVVYGKVKLPITGPAEIISLVERTLPPNAGLAVFDAVTSNTAVRLPLRELTRICHERGVRVLIDAAHALGQLDIDGADYVTNPDGTYSTPPQKRNDSGGNDDRAPQRGGASSSSSSSLSPSSSPPASPGGPQAVGADFWVANCHKWLCAPRGTAVFWVRRELQPYVAPPVVSHGTGSGFASEFIWDGCRDYAPYLAVSAALQMWDALGPQRCLRYSRRLLAAAVSLLVRQWHLPPALGGGNGSDGPPPVAGAGGEEGCRRCDDADEGIRGSGREGHRREPAGDGLGDLALFLDEQEAAKYMIAPLSMCGSMALVALPATLQKKVVASVREREGGKSCPFARTAVASIGAATEDRGPPEAGSWEEASSRDDEGGGGAAATSRAGGPSPGVWSSVGATPEYCATSADAKFVQDQLHFLHRVECPVKEVAGRLFVRISCAIYNELDDYRRLASAVDDIISGSAAAAAADSN